MSTVRFRLAAQSAQSALFWYSQAISHQRGAHSFAVFEALRIPPFAWLAVSFALATAGGRHPGLEPRQDRSHSAGAAIHGKNPEHDLR